MTTKKKVLVTGANGEVGCGLIPVLAKEGAYEIIALDITKLKKPLKPYISKFFLGNVINKNFLATLFDKHKIGLVFHLAAILSTTAESKPEKAHRVNVDGTLNLLRLANKYSGFQGKSIKFIFPSTIAVYGLPNIRNKKKEGAIKENDYNQPITMYGINKLYCEYLGKYYSRMVDFRCIRFPGIISAATVPLGGTSDYAPEMLHSAAQGENYLSYVRPDTKIPFMAMPDAIRALNNITRVPRKKLRQQVYNATGFSAKTRDIEKIIKKAFPKAKITYKTDPLRQNIVDSWPEDINDYAARRDWDWKPEYNFKNAFEKYLIPETKKNYQ